MITELDNKNKTNNKWRKSLFLCTINTNKSFNCIDEKTCERLPEIKAKLIKLLEDLFTKKNIIRLTYDLGPVGNKDKKSINPERIKDIEIKSQIETNYNGRGFIHSHTLIEIVHNTRVQLDLVAIKNIIYKFLEKSLTFNGKFNKPYINIRATRSSSFAIENYVSPDYGKDTEITKIN